MKSSPIRRWSAFLSLVAWAVPALAASDGPAVLQAQSLAATCAACHGSQGRAIGGAAVPGLAGLPAGYFVEQMRAFKSGARTATVMHQIAKGYTDAQVEQLAAWFAAQPK